MKELGIHSSSYDYSKGSYMPIIGEVKVNKTRTYNVGFFFTITFSVKGKL